MLVLLDTIMTAVQHEKCTTDVVKTWISAEKSKVNQKWAASPATY